MIDQQVHDALAAQISAVDPERSAEAWTRIETAGTVGRRRRQRRTAGALAAAVLVVGAIVAVGLGQGSPSSEKVATSPTTGLHVGPTVAPSVAPPPAPSVAEPLWQASTLRSGFSVVSWAAGGSWSAARTAGDGRDLVLATSGCHDRFGAVVQDLGDRVSVQLAVADGPHLQCLMNEQVRVRLPEPLAGRPLVDGPSGVPGPLVDGSTLLVPHVLPASTRLQGETLTIAAWQACYQADPPRRSPDGSGGTASTTPCTFDGARPMVTTAQSHDLDAVLSLGILSADSIHPIYATSALVAPHYVSGPSSPHPGKILVATAVPGGVDGRGTTLLSTGLHDVVVWSEGTTWLAVATPHGVGGVTPTELVRIAQSLRPVG